ncbi:hypothetical protein EDB84DRAFT_1672875 [Lactarius hengduanensis]|nr:hypothetical protein EDB84DRAFT_1672875 [Lactarius hengduanensis]
MPRPNPVCLYSNFPLAFNLASVVTDSRYILYLEFPRERRRWKEYLPVAAVRSATLGGSKHGDPTYLEPSYCEIISVVVVTPISPRALFSATSYAPTSGAISELGLLLALHEAPRHAASGQGTPTVLRIAWFRQSYAHFTRYLLVFYGANTLHCALNFGREGNSDVKQEPRTFFPNAAQGGLGLTIPSTESQLHIVLDFTAPWTMSRVAHYHQSAQSSVYPIRRQWKDDYWIWQRLRRSPRKMLLERSIEGVLLGVLVESEVGRGAVPSQCGSSVRPSESPVERADVLGRAASEGLDWRRSARPRSAR